MKLFIGSCLLVVLVACSSASSTIPQASIPNTPIPIDAVPTVDPSDTRLTDAQYQYNLRCAHCHGYGGEGQIEETIQQTINLGYHTIPAHDASGHTWQHPDQLLFEVIKYGVDSPTNLYKMNRYDTTLTDEQIFAVIDYIKIWWTDDQREWQAQLTEQFAEMNPYWEESNLDALQGDSEESDNE